MVEFSSKIQMADECLHCQTIGVKVACKDFPLLRFCNEECAAASWEQGDFREATTALYAAKGYNGVPYSTIPQTAYFIEILYQKLLSGINFQKYGADFFEADYSSLLKNANGDTEPTVSTYANVISVTNTPGQSKPTYADGSAVARARKGDSGSSSQYTRPPTTNTSAGPTTGTYTSSETQPEENMEQKWIKWNNKWINTVNTGITNRWAKKGEREKFSTENKDGDKYEYEVLRFDKTVKKDSCPQIDNEEYKVIEFKIEKEKMVLSETYIERQLAKIKSDYLDSNGDFKRIFPEEWMLYPTTGGKLDKSARFGPSRSNNPSPVSAEIFAAFIATIYRYLRFSDKNEKFSKAGYDQLWVIYYEFRLLIEQPMYIGASGQSYPIFLEFVRHVADDVYWNRDRVNVLQNFLYQLCSKNEVTTVQRFREKNYEVYNAMYKEREKLVEFSEFFRENPDIHVYTRLILTRCIRASNGTLY